MSAGRKIYERPLAIFVWTTDRRTTKKQKPQKKSGVNFWSTGGPGVIANNHIMVHSKIIMKKIINK